MRGVDRERGRATGEFYMAMMGLRSGKRHLLRSHTGGPDLLKWGLPGGGVKSAKVAPSPCYV